MEVHYPKTTTQTYDKNINKRKKPKRKKNLHKKTTKNTSYGGNDIFQLMVMPYQEKLTNN